MVHVYILDRKRNVATGYAIVMLSFCSNSSSETWNSINRKCYFCHFLTVYWSFVALIKARFKVDVRKFNTCFVVYVFSLPLCYISNSDMDSSKSHPSHDWHRTKMSAAIKLPTFTGSRVTSFHWGRKYLAVSKSSEFNENVFRHCFYFLWHQNCLATWDRMTLGFYFPLAVLGSTGEQFGFAKLRS